MQIPYLVEQVPVGLGVAGDRTQGAVDEPVDGPWFLSVRLAVGSLDLLPEFRADPSPLAGSDPSVLELFSDAEGPLSRIELGLFSEGSSRDVSTLGLQPGWVTNSAERAEYPGLPLSQDDDLS